MDNTEDKKQDDIVLRSGQFTVDEDRYIIAHYSNLTGQQVADGLHRTASSVRQRINKLQDMGKLAKTGKKHKSKAKANNDSFVGTLADAEKKVYFKDEITSSIRYRSMKKAFTNEELELYIEKYVEFMCEPTIETVTSEEKGTLHQMIISEIRIIRFLEEEKADKELAKKENKGRIPISRSREIKECQEIIAKCQRSLNVEREQRLKNQSDQAITFTNLIRDLKNPSIRVKAGKEAAMLKYMAEKFYNDHLGKNILSGKSTIFDIGASFKNGNEPPNLTSNFTTLPEEKINKEEKQEEQNGRNENTGTSGDTA